MVVLVSSSSGGSASSAGWSGWGEIDLRGRPRFEAGGVDTDNDLRGRPRPRRSGSGVVAGSQASSWSELSDTDGSIVSSAGM